MVTRSGAGRGLWRWGPGCRSTRRGLRGGRGLSALGQARALGWGGAEVALPGDPVCEGPRSPEASASPAAHAPGRPRALHPDPAPGEPRGVRWAAVAGRPHPGGERQQPAGRRLPEVPLPPHLGRGARSTLPASLASPDPPSRPCPSPPRRGPPSSLPPDWGLKCFTIHNCRSPRLSPVLLGAALLMLSHFGCKGFSQFL